LSSTNVAVIVLSFLSVGTTLLGVLLAALIQENVRIIALGIGFSAGIMVLISAMELLPEAGAAIGVTNTTLVAGAGATILWLANLAIPHTHLVREHRLADTRLVKSVYLVVIGLILHDAPEGFAMANAYVASPSLGLFVALAIALHNLPEEFAMAVPAMTLRSKRFLFGAALLSALAEPAGAIVGLIAVTARPALNAWFIGFAAGAMLFVSLHELAPMAHRYGKLAWFAAGVALSIVTHRLLSLVTIG
jgi:ZIP family zinc transporter